MLEFDGLTQDETASVAHSIPPEVFEGPIGFFESFRLWDLDIERWKRSDSPAADFPVRITRTREYLHHLCHWGEDGRPGDPAGHALSTWQRDERGRLHSGSVSQINPYSVQSVDLEEWLAGSDEGATEGTVYVRMVRIPAWSVFLLCRGLELYPATVDDVDEPRLVRPTSVTVLHSRTHFVVDSGTPYRDQSAEALLIRLHEALQDGEPMGGFDWSDEDDLPPGAPGRGGTAGGPGAGGDVPVVTLDDAIQRLRRRMGEVRDFDELVMEMFGDEGPDPFILEELRRIQEQGGFGAGGHGEGGT